ncbi:hypothetical protein QM565_14675 [Geitlerinema splendidum]|nr:hypothetical protein [Geitlerinema splendidum]
MALVRPVGISGLYAKSAQQSSPQTSQKVTISCPQLTEKDYKYGTSGTAFYINIKDAPAYYYYYKFWKTKIGNFSGSYFNGNIENTGKVKLKSIKTTLVDRLIKPFYTATQ